MIYLETVLLVTLVCVSIYSSITDVKDGIVHNKGLLYALAIGGIAGVVYYRLFAQEYFPTFAVNLLSAFVIAIAFYAYHIWAAGDSKLFILIAALIPARLYSQNGLQAIPSMSILIYTFSIAFAYVIIESAVLDIRQKQPITFKSDFKTDLKFFLKQYLYCTIYLIAFYKVMQLVLPQEYSNNTQLILLLNILFVLTLTNFNPFKPLYLIIGAIVATTGFLISGTQNFGDLPDWKTFGVMIFLLLLRKIGQRHNYKEIATDDVQAGMVLSFTTIAMFMNSKIQGLPQFTSEDIGSRIDSNEVQAIKLWGKSKTGKPQIVIVRKIPFAIFISIGMLIVLCGVII